MSIIKPLTGELLTIEDVIKVATTKELDVVEIDPDALAQCKKSEDLIKEKGDQGKVIYGVTTGFGSNRVS